MAVPLIALGLSADSSFIEKVLKAVNPFKFGDKSGLAAPFEVNQMTLKDFIKIFKKDQVSEKLTETIREIVEKEKEAKQRKLQRNFEKKKDKLRMMEGGARNTSTDRVNETGKINEVDDSDSDH